LIEDNYGSNNHNLPRGMKKNNKKIFVSFPTNLN